MDAIPVLRFTMPHDVAHLVDFDRLDTHALRFGIPTLTYRQHTPAGIEIGCSRDYTPLLLGAIEAAVSNPWEARHREACAEVLARIVDFLEKTKPS
jgi:hypothetical protein